MQKALGNILHHYLRQETLVSGEDGGVDEELLESLHKCLEEKGVMKEVHAFLRKRLVAVLQGTWPQLFDHFRTDADLNPTVLKLVEDFLCSHKLLFTFSILSTELGETFSPKVGFGKFPSADAEKFLEKLGIPANSVQSDAILENYARTGKSSLLESIVNFSPAGVSLLIQKSDGTQLEPDSGDISQNTKNFLTLDEKLKKIDDKYLRHQEKKHNNLRRAESLSVDQRFRHLALDLERDKQIQLQIAIDKFKTEEISRIREEIVTEQKFELLRKEKELLSNYEEKVTHMKNNLEREKELWLVEKMQKEREIFERREELLLAIQNVRETVRQDKVNESGTQTEERSEELRRQSYAGGVIIQDDHFDRIQPSAFLFEKTPAQREMERAYLLKEAKLRSAIEKLQNENAKLKATPPSSPINSKRRSRVEDAEVSTTSEDYHRQRYYITRRSIEATQQRSPKKPPTTDPRHGRPGETRWTHQYTAHGNEEDERKTGQEEGFVPVPLSARDSDAVAFLQYQLECQSDEIEKLRSVVQMRVTAEVSPPRTIKFIPENGGQTRKQTSPPSIIPKSLEGTDVDDFLREAKKRISDIEQEAHLVEETLIRMNRVDKVSNPFPAGGKTAEKRTHPQLPLPPTFPKSLFQRINSIRQLTTIPNYLTSGSRDPVISIPPMEKCQSLTDYSKNPGEASPYQQHLGHQGQVPVSRLRVPFLHGDETVESPKDNRLTERDRDDEPPSEKSTTSFSTSATPLPPERKTEMANSGRRVNNQVAEDPRLSIQTNTSTASVRNRKGRRSQRSDREESPDHPAPKDVNEGLMEAVTGNMGLDDLGSSGSLKDKANRSGALVKNKVGNNLGDEEPGPGCGGDTTSSIATLKSSSFNCNKSLEKVLKPPTQNLSPPSPGERRLGRDLKSNPINANYAAAGGPSTFPFHPLTTPPLTVTGASAQKLEDELDDLGNLETSKDTLDLDDNDLFWQM